MESLLSLLSRHNAVAVLVLALIVVALAIVTASYARRLARSESRWRQLLEGVRGDNLERLLEHHLREKIVLEEELARTKGRVSELEARVKKALRHVGLVRFDAFDEVGGAQSFALAVLDDNGDGTVLNGLIGRTDSRVYCKPIAGHASPHNLSREELTAIEQARQTGP